MLRLRPARNPVILLLLGVLLASTVAMAGPPADVVGRPCAADVERLQQLGVISGYPDGTFKPDNPIRRCEMAKIIVTARREEALAGLLKGARPFPDVPGEHWASGYVALASVQSVIKGYPDGQFRPEASVTYAETLVMLLRAVGREPAGGTWPSNVLGAAAGLGVTSGLSFDPNTPAPRGDVAILTARVVFGVTNVTTGKTLAEAFPAEQGSTSAEIQLPPEPPGSPPQPPETPPEPGGATVTSTGRTEVHFIDVGQGDAILIVTPSRNAILVDAGPNAAATGLVAYLQGLNLPDIDAAVVTHAHADHIGGMDEVLDAFPVGAFYDTGYQYDSVGYRELISLVNSKGIPTITARKGTTIDVDPLVRAEVLSPKSLGSDCNDNSIVLKVSYGTWSTLLMGDASSMTEIGLRYDQDVKPKLRTDVLKIGHHGSFYSTSSSFLTEVSPAAAVICVGSNSYGHPTSSVLSALTVRGISVYRTDLHGTVTVTSDGSTYTVTSARGGSSSGSGTGGTTTGAPPPPPATPPAPPPSEPSQFVISVAASPSSAGTVSGGGTCTVGQSVTVQAIALTGYRFVAWKDGSTTVSTSATYSFTAAGGQSLSAEFEAVPPTPPPAQNYIGNKNTKKFHLPSCSYLPNEENRVYFSTRQLAIDAGYTPCGHCDP